MKYGIYNSAGIVLRIGSCPDQYLETQVRPNEYLYRGEIELTDRVNLQTGLKIKSLAGQAPGKNYVFDPVADRWVQDVDAAWAEVKTTRSKLLSETDWMVVRAQENGAELSDEWKAYRQALRDITDQPNPFSITWPVKPSV